MQSWSLISGIYLFVLLATRSWLALCLTYWICCTLSQILSKLSETNTVCKEFQEQINNELELFQKTLSSSQIYPEQAISTESRADSQEHIDGNSKDLEAGKLQNTEKQTVSITAHKKAERTNKEEDTEDKKKLRKDDSMSRCNRVLH